VSQWILREWTDNIETSEIGGVLQYRHHFVFARYQKVMAASSWNEAVGDTTNTIDYFVGGVQKIKSFVGLAGSPKYVCVSDGIAPEQPGTPGEYIVREQVWEYYGEWKDVPDSWGWA
jgi:hypothetical protein